MTKGESILIEKTANDGYIITPKDIIGVMDTRKHVAVVDSLKGLCEWLKDHFSDESKPGLKVVSK